MFAGEYDKRERGLLLNNLRNIAANADIQNFESSIINQAMVMLDEWLIENNMKSYIFNMVHDSCDIVLYHDERDIIIPKLREYFEYAREEYKRIPLPIDISIADLTTGDYYKHGQEI
jgi:DNA polymerase I-like protein with 3'-5' exonuclease and polymerase domains